MNVGPAASGSERAWSHWSTLCDRDVDIHPSCWCSVVVVHSSNSEDAWISADSTGSSHVFPSLWRSLARSDDGHGSTQPTVPVTSPDSTRPCKKLFFMIRPDLIHSCTKYQFTTMLHTISTNQQHTCMDT